LSKSEGWSSGLIKKSNNFDFFASNPGDSTENGKTGIQATGRILTTAGRTAIVGKPQATPGTPVPGGTQGTEGTSETVGTFTAAGTPTTGETS
jgi:hypothetical protein